MAELTIVNQHAIRHSIKRIFNNDIRAILGELLQNSQRAGATQVTVGTDTDILIYQDNGHGLRDGQAFFTLLAMGASAFDTTTLQDQDPMGIGVHAALAHKDIRQVIFESGRRRLVIDTARWWNEKPYYMQVFRDTSEDRFTLLDTPVRGLRVTFLATADLVTAGKSHLMITQSWTRMNWRKQLPLGCGYAGYFTLTVDDVPAPMDIPETGHLLTTFTYQDSRVRVWHDTVLPSMVTWYGQRIDVPTTGAIRWDMTVIRGRPVNPSAPVRSHLIDDQDFARFKQAVRHALFTAIRAMPDPSPTLLESYNLYDSEHFRKLDHFLAYEITPRDPVRSDTEQDWIRHSLQTFRYTTPPYLFNEGLRVIGEDDDALCGSASFENEIRQHARDLTGSESIYTIYQGDEDRLASWSLAWNPGEPDTRVSPHIGYSTFHARGTYRMEQWVQGTIRAATDTMPVVSKHVIAVFETATNDVDDARWIGASTDPIAFFTGVIWFAWDFSEASEEAYAQREEDFQKSVEDIIRKLIGACVPYDWTLYDVQQQVSGRVHTISPQYNAEAKIIGLEVLAGDDSPVLFSLTLF